MVQLLKLPLAFKEQPPQPMNHVSEDGTVSDAKVLLLDDNLLEVMKIEKSLKASGYDVARLTSPNGVLAKIDYEKPEVLLINPWMPRLDVGDLLEMLASAPEFEDLVVVALGDKDAATLQAFCIEHDLHGYYSKSMDLSKIGLFVDNFFEDE